MLYLHPFAEEMNKSRRMAAMQSRALAAVGWTVLQFDQFGCGDSEGEFGEATWDRWLDDTCACLEWLGTETGVVPVVWGLRTGALLALHATRVLKSSPDLLLWQPVISGRRYLRQFLRLGVASQLGVADGPAGVRTERLRDQLGQGGSVEVGGYAISSGLALGLEASELIPPPAQARVAWLEIAGGTAIELSPASGQCVENWRAAGHRVDVHVVEGLPFWQTQEIAECPALIQATLSAVGAWRS